MAHNSVEGHIYQHHSRELDENTLETVTVKVFRGEVEVATQLISTPTTAGEATAALRERKVEWVGTLQKPQVEVILAGGYPLTPGGTYHLFLQDQSGVDNTETLRTVLREELERRSDKARTKGPKAFSSVGSGEARSLLIELELVEVVGNEVEPINVPADAPKPGSFSYEDYPDGNAGTPSLLAHHQKQLELFGVNFGRSGFKMYDLHNKKSLYSIKANSWQKYSGTVDGSIAPYGLSHDSASCHSRIAYKHKQSEEQKQIYCTNHPTEYEGHDTASEACGSIAFEGRNKGQSIIAMLGAYAYNDYPLIIDLTDGVTHHLLQIRGDELFTWTGLTPRQSYFKQAQLLKSLPDLLPCRSLKMERIPEELQVPLKKMRMMREQSALQDQLGSVCFLPESERIGAAYEIIAAWEAAAPVGMSPDALAMYV